MWKVRWRRWIDLRSFSQGKKKKYGKSQEEIEDWEVNSLKGMHIYVGQEQSLRHWVISILQSEYHCSSIYKVLSAVTYSIIKKWEPYLFLAQRIQKKNKVLQWRRQNINKKSNEHDNLWQWYMSRKKIINNEIKIKGGECEGGDTWGEWRSVGRAFEQGQHQVEVSAAGLRMV